MPAGEEKSSLRLEPSPVLPEKEIRVIRQDRITLLPSLAFSDKETHPFRINIRNLNAQGLTDAKAAAIAKRKNCAVFQTGYSV